MTKKTSPQEAYEALKRLYKLLYIREEGNLTYEGFDLRQIDINGVAEVILFHGEPVQVRNLIDVPYDPNTIKFGDF